MPRLALTILRTLTIRSRVANAQLPSRLISTSSPKSFARPSSSLLNSSSSSTPKASSASEPPRDKGEQAIYDKLAARFAGTQLEVQDVSGGCGSFYAIVISSPAFKDLSTIKQHRLVNDCLKEEVKGIHGLQLKTIPE